MPVTVRRTTPLWPLPALIALLFLVATHLAFWLSIRAGHAPACVPYWEGCVSISRAARHGLGNHLFRLLVIPCAVLHATVWWLAAHWLREREEEDLRDAALAWMQALGILSALALAVYAAFLGTEGEIYGFLRRYGVTVYFGFGYLAQMLLLRRAIVLGRLRGRFAGAMAVLCAAMLALGVANIIAGAILEDAALRDRVENALEWLLGLLLVTWYLLLASAWRRDGFAVQLRHNGKP